MEALTYWGKEEGEAAWILAPASSTVYVCYSITNAKCVGSPWGKNQDFLFKRSIY